MPGSIEGRRAARRSDRAPVPALFALALFGLAGCDAMTEVAPPATAPAPTVAAAASAKGRVDIEGGVIRLAARRDGVIAKVLVEEGDRVKAGQVLATLDDELAQRGLTLAQREVAQAEQDIKKARAELAAAEREIKRLEPLTRTAIAPRQELDRAHDTRALAEAAVQAGQAAIETAKARQSVSAREIEERKIVAPLDGQILQRQARPGNGVSTLNVTPLFLFAPRAPRIVRAELEEQYLDAVALNQAVEIVLEADPDQKWSGTVVRVGRIVGAKTPSEDPAEKQDNRVVEVVIAFDGAEALLIGQRVIVRFIAA